MRPPPLADPPSCPLERLAAVVPGARTAGGDALVRGTTHDSRAVRPGDLFAALPGARSHGAQHAGRAVAAGAVAVLTDPCGLAAAARCGVPVLVVPEAAAALGPLAAELYDHPSRDLDVVGVTGTDGKTTTAWLVAAALEAAGVATGLLGSVEVRLGDATVLTEEPQHRRTTPEAGDLQETLALVRERGGRAVAMEASSHGLALGRTSGTRFAAGVFTNLGHEHLDFHGDLDRYLAAKARLVEAAEHAVVNVDDPRGAALAAARSPARPTSTVSTAPGARASATPTWRAVDVVCRATSSTFTALGPGGTRTGVALRLAGRFNVDNALAALAAVAALGVDPADAARGLGSLAGVPGRMQWVVPDGEVRALVDYAHTPGALAALLAAARHAAGGGRVVLVVGTGGGRDASKRAAMGQAAAAGADVVVITDDNPRHEDPALIRGGLRAGTRQAAGSGAEVHEIADRTAAVRAAARLAAPGDVVVVAGKGPDRVQLVAGDVVAVDDAAVLRQELRSAGAAPGG